MEILSAYTEVDPNSRIATTTRRATWTDLTISESAYVYTDKGADRFDGNFVHLLTVEMASGTNDGETYCWALTNTVALMRAIDEANGSYLSAYVYYYDTPFLYIEECDSGTTGAGYNDAYAISLNTPYYLKIVRDESVGDYGTLYCYIYSDPGRTTLVDTLSITLHTSEKDYRYIFALNSLGAGTTQKTSGYVENLELIYVLLEVTTQPVTAITDTTATGNGIIVDTGIATVTQHGHCWDSTIDPTTTDSSSGLWGKTSNGEGAVGAFTSTMESLVAGQRYFVRTYATSTEGTVYGANVTFTAGYTSTQLIEGNLAVVQERLHYIDAYGVERYIMGTPV